MVGYQPLAFHDFAGSAVVHMVGGAVGLAGVQMLGPRVLDVLRRTVFARNSSLIDATSCCWRGYFDLWLDWF